MLIFLFFLRKYVATPALRKMSRALHDISRNERSNLEKLPLISPLSVKLLSPVLSLTFSLFVPYSVHP